MTDLLHVKTVTESGEPAPDVVVELVDLRTGRIIASEWTGDAGTIILHAPPPPVLAVRFTDNGGHAHQLPLSDHWAGMHIEHTIRETASKAGLAQSEEAS